MIKEKRPVGFRERHQGPEMAISGRKLTLACLEFLRKTSAVLREAKAAKSLQTQDPVMVLRWSEYPQHDKRVAAISVENTVTAPRAAADGVLLIARNQREPARCIGDADGDSFQLCNKAERPGRIVARDEQRDLRQIIPGIAREMDLHG